jgi:hypothetical protein
MKKKYIMLILFCLACFSLMNSDVYCDHQEREDILAVRDQQEHYRENQGVPFYEWSIELDAAIQIYNARIRDVVKTWTVWRSDYGIIEGSCASIGYPIPYDVQLTNPLKPGYSSSSVVEQAEPSGLYSSHNSIATWVRQVVTIDGKAIVTPIYVEGKVTCYPYPIKVDYDKNRVTPVKNTMPSVIITSNKPEDIKKVPRD